MTRRVPAEWESHQSTWMAMPYLKDEWKDLEAAQAEITKLALSIAEAEPVEMLCAPVPPDEITNHKNIRIHRLDYGDAWIRDTGPLFTETSALTFEFNGWGEKYLMPGDTLVARQVCEAAGVTSEHQDFVLEGGAVEFDGDGTLLTTQCVTLPNRKPPTDMLTRLADVFECKVLMLEGALQNDHTDGHIDTLVRFVKPGEVLVMRGNASDPNGAMLLMLEEQLHELTDAQGRRFKVHTIPSPGAVVNNTGELLPASYCNYVFARDRLIVPTYGCPNDDAAISALSELFPARKVIGLSARAIIEGGGAFHCITQQEPQRV